MEEKLSIRVNIADRFYPLKIDRSEEERIRKAAKKINDTITQYKNKYGDKDLQDFLSMVALQYATKTLEFEEVTDDSYFIQEVKDITRELDEYIQQII